MVQIIVHSLKQNTRDLYITGNGKNGSSIGKTFDNTEIDFEVIGDDWGFTGTFTIDIPVAGFGDAKKLIREKVLNKGVRESTTDEIAENLVERIEKHLYGNKP